MPNFFSICMAILRAALKLSGLRPHKIEIEPGTIINIWGPPYIKPNRKSIVFLHGFAANGIFNWQFQALALAWEYSVYVPDFLFFGESTTTRPDRSPGFQAECMAKALKELGVERCTLVGLSYGGMVGFKMAELFPELVESLVASCTVMAMTESVSSESLRRIGFKKWSDLLLPERGDDLKKMFGVGSYKVPNVPNWIFKHFLEVMFDNRKEKKELLDALVIPDKYFTIPKYSQKVGLLWGQSDKIFNMETASNLKMQLGEKALTLESIEKAGHLANLDRPFVYNNRLKQILVNLLKET